MRDYLGTEQSQVMIPCVLVAIKDSLTITHTHLIPS